MVGRLVQEHWLIYALFALVMFRFFSFIIRTKFYAIVCILFLLSSIDFNITQSFQLDSCFSLRCHDFETYKRNDFKPK